jgi:DNA-binding FrmR family transcriptional regulator
MYRTLYPWGVSRMNGNHGENGHQRRVGEGRSGERGAAAGMLDGRSAAAPQRLPKPDRAHHPADTKRSLTARLKRIEGQVRGIAGMIERDVYCDDILHQITAVEAALGGVRRLLLEAHIRSCVVEQVLQGREQVIDELMTTIGKMSR